MIEVTRKLVFNLDRYEQMETTVTVTGIPDDEEPGRISEMLDDLMYPEIERAALATAHADEDNSTCVYTWKSIASKEGADA